MLRIDLSQRVDIIPGRGERCDGLDQRWYSLCAELGAMAIPLPNGVLLEAELIDGLELHGIILTGGNRPKLRMWRANGTAWNMAGHCWVFAGACR